MLTHCWSDAGPRLLVVCQTDFAAHLALRQNEGLSFFFNDLQQLKKEQFKKRSLQISAAAVAEAC